MSNLKDKSQSLAERMNKLTESFVKNLDTADDMVLTGNDIIEYVDEKTQEIKLYTEEQDVDTDTLAKIINLENMVDDFKYVRETLKENTDNGRRVLNSITLDLLDSDDDKRATLILSFAELNKAVADNMRLYIQSYKEVSNVLLNLDKIKKAEKADSPKINNTLNINGPSIVSTMELIKRLSDA